MHQTMPMCRLVFLSALLLAGLAVSSPSPAEACSRSFGSGIVLPEMRATDVPRNVTLFLGNGHIGDATEAEVIERFDLLDPDDVPVPFTVTSLSSPESLRLLVVRPAELLAPGTQYRLAAESSNALVFTTGDDVDEEAPSPPVETGRTTRSVVLAPGVVNTCVDGSEYEFAILDVESDGALVVLNIDDRTTLDELALDGRVGQFTEDAFVMINASNWPDIAPSATTRVRLGAFDLAGNFSGWSDPIEVTLPPRGCSCESSIVDARASAWTLAALLGVAPRRRRTR